MLDEKQKIRVNVSGKLKLQHPPQKKLPGHTRAFEAFSCQGRRKFDELSLPGLIGLIVLINLAKKCCLSLNEVMIWVSHLQKKKETCAKAVVIFLGVGALDHLKWTYDGAFEQLFGLGRVDFNKNFPKIQMPLGLPGGLMLKLIFDWCIKKSHRELWL